MAASAGALAIGTVVATSVNGGAAAVPANIIAEDSFNRVTSSGLGTADVGGVYSSWSQATSTSVTAGAVQVSGLRPGGTVRATLPQAVALNQRVSGRFSLPVMPSEGRGLTLALVLRHAAGGAEYNAKARVLPSGQVMLSLSERDPLNPERFLDREVALPAVVSVGHPFSVEAEVTGTTQVDLRARAWMDGDAVPNYQAAVSDSASRRVGEAGSLGWWAYTSTSTSATSLSVTHFEGLDLTPTDPATPSASLSVTPTATKTLPLSTAPTTAASTTTAATTTAATTTATTSSSTTPTTHSSTTASSTPPATPTTTSSSTAPPPPATSDGSDAGSAPIGSTAYPVPAGALYVAPSGNDTNPGTVGAPLRTLSRAISVAPAGSTIVLRAGTYHESVEIPSTKPGLTIQSAPKEAVRLDGSSVVANWSKVGANWVSGGWTAEFDSTPGYGDAAAVALGWSFINSSYPMAAHPDQVWIDGRKLAQVGSESDVRPGSFYADYSGNRLIIGNDPAGQEVRASDLALAVTIRAASTQLRGLAVAHYATPVNQFGAVRLIGNGDKIENLSISDTATTGVTVLNSNAVIDHVSLLDNGLLGMHANYSDNLRVDSILVRGNNNEHFNQSPVAGGIKITKARTLTINNSVIENNYATGLWMDCSNYNGTFTNNIVRNNTGHGIFYEISAKAVIANNTVANNGGDGLKINDSDQVRIWNNTITGNGRNIELVQDSRLESDPNAYGRDARQPFPDPTVTWLMRDIQVMNNVLSVGGGYNIYARDYTGQRSLADINIKINGNLFSTSPSSGQAELIWSVTNGALVTCLTVADIARTGAGANNLEDSAVRLSPRASSNAEPLPADIAALVGQNAGVRYIGAF